MIIADCKQIQEIIPLYIDNMLSDEEQNAVRAHIETCEACKAEYELMASIIKTAASLPELDVPEGFHEKLMEKVKAEAEKKQERKMYALPWKKISGFAAAAAVIAVSVVSFMQLDRENNQTNPDVYLKNPAPISTHDSEANDETVEKTVQVPDEDVAEQPAVQTENPAVKVESSTPAPTAKADQAKASAMPTVKATAPTAETPKPTSDNKENTVSAEKANGIHTPQTAADSRVAPEPAAEAVADHTAEYAPTSKPKPTPTPKTADSTTAAPQKSSSASSGGSKSPASSGGGSGGGGGGGSSAARPAAQFRIASVTVAESAMAQAKEILSAYAKDANGYKVGEGLDAVLNKLSKLEGYQVTTQTSSKVSANYIILK